MQKEFILILLLFTIISCSEKNTNNDKVKLTEQIKDKTEIKEQSGSLSMTEIREKLKKELGEKYNAPMKKLTPKQLAQGKIIYEDRCAKCHGLKGKGDGSYGKGLTIPPADFTDSTRAAFYSDEARKQIIRKGIIGTVMFAWEDKLSEKEIDVVYAYIKTFSKSKK